MTGNEQPLRYRLELADKIRAGGYEAEPLALARIHASIRSRRPMEITEVRVFPVEEDKLKAYATITFDNCFVIREIKVIRGASGYFISMPSRKTSDGTYKDIAHPTNKETRAMIESRILEEYHKTIAAPSR